MAFSWSPGCGQERQAVRSDGPGRDRGRGHGPAGATSRTSGERQEVPAQGDCQPVPLGAVPAAPSGQTPRHWLVELKSPAPPKAHPQVTGASTAAEGLPGSQ